MFFLLSLFVFVCLVEIVSVVGEPNTGQQREQEAQQRKGEGNTNRLEQSVAGPFIYHAGENKRVSHESREQIQEDAPSPILRRVALDNALLDSQ